jgi:hypothetical protein
VEAVLSPQLEFSWIPWGGEGQAVGSGSPPLSAHISLDISLTLLSVMFSGALQGNAKYHLLTKNVGTPAAHESFLFYFGLIKNKKKTSNFLKTHLI